MTLKNTSSIVKQPIAQPSIDLSLVTTQPSSTAGPFSACLSIKNTTEEMINDVKIDWENASSWEKGAVIGAVSGGVVGLAATVAASSPVGFFGACMAGMARELITISLGATLGGNIGAQAEPEPNQANKIKQK